MPWPSTFPPEFIPIALRIGPFTISTGPTGIVVASTPWMLNSSVHAASSAARITGMYSGFAPAITALIATFSTVHSTRSGGTTATMSSGARVVPWSIRSTRASVGATTGRPSVHPRSKSASASSSSAAISTRRLRRTDPPNRTASTSTMSGSTDSDPHPGRMLGQVRTQAGHACELLPRRAEPADGAGDLGAALHLDQGRDGLDVVVVRDGEVVVESRLEALGERRVVLGVDGQSGARFTKLAEHRGDEHTSGALGLDDGDDAFGQWHIWTLTVV